MTIFHVDEHAGPGVILKEAITLSALVPFAVFYMGESLKVDYLWAAFCMVGAVYFIFRS